MNNELSRTQTSLKQKDEELEAFKRSSEVMQKEHNARIQTIKKEIALADVNCADDVNRKELHSKKEHVQEKRNS